MKRHISLVLSLGLATVLVSCGTSGETNENPSVTTEQETVESKEEPKIEVAPYTVEEMGEFNYSVQVNYGDIITIMDENQLIGYMDADGNILCEPKYERVGYSDGMLTLEDPSDSGMGKSYYQSLDGKVVIDQVNGQGIAHTENFSNGYAKIDLLDSDGEYEGTDKIIDKQGNVVLETDIPNAFYHRDEDGNFILRDLDKGKIYEVYKKDLTPMSAEEISENEDLDGDDVVYADGLYVVQEYGYNATALYDKEKEQVITDYKVYVAPRKIGENYLLAKQDANDEDAYWYIINDKYENLAKLDYDFDFAYTPDIINNKIVLHYEDGSSPKILDELGNIYKETNYDGIYAIGANNDVYFVVDNKTGMLNKDFNEVIPAEYESNTEIVDGVGFATKGNVLYKITANK